MLVLEAVCVEIYVAQCEPITRQDGAKKTEDGGERRPIEHALRSTPSLLSIDCSYPERTPKRWLG
jgi:hypothetical protein